MTGQAPTIKHQRYIVLAAFDRGGDGELYPAFEPREAPSQERAVQQAKEMATRHAGVIVWARTAMPDQGEFGDPEIIFERGAVPNPE